ncbi:MAG: 30S ribosomal protein S20 [Planctomycetota bacterium]
MAHSRTAKKNIRKGLKRRDANKAVVSALRTQIKKVRTAALGKDVAGATAQYATAQRLLDKAANSRRIHPRKAARLKSRLSRLLHASG